MPNGTFFQTPTGTASTSAPIRTPSSNSIEKSSTQSRPQPNGTTSTSASPTDVQEAVNELTTSIDDFISEVESKFKVVSNEILSKHDMAERCDRIETELQLSSHGGGSADGDANSGGAGAGGTGNGIKTESAAAA